MARDLSRQEVCGGLTDSGVVCGMMLRPQFKSDIQLTEEYSLVTIFVESTRYGPLWPPKAP
jgi:hypothetical protein